MIDPQLCSIEDCDKIVTARGWCSKHYTLWYRHGDPLVVRLVGGPATHGHASVGNETPTYNTWQSMKQRCQNPKDQAYKYYGGRGITVDPRWDSFESFLDDMGVRPEGSTIDRIDPDGDYTPENCRWATPLEQRHNRRDRSGLLEGDPE